MNIQFDKEVLAKMVEMVEKGETKGKIEGFGKYIHNHSTNEAKAYATKAFEECGLSSNAYGKADHKETIAFLRANHEKLGKKDLINGMCEVNGKTYKTNQHAYNYIAMMIEWSNQEKANS